MKVGFENDKLVIGEVQGLDREGCLACKSFTTIGKEGVSGYLKLAHGNTPSNYEPGFAMLYVKSDGKLYFQNSAGVELKVLCRK